MELSAGGDLTFPEATGWAPPSSNQEIPVLQGHRPQRGTTALGPRGPPLHRPPASNPCLMPRTRKALLAVLGSSLLFFLSPHVTIAAELCLLPTGNKHNKRRRGKVTCRAASPAFLSWFVAPYRRAKACGPGCFIVTAQPLGTEPHWPFSHAFTSAEGEASSMRTLHCEDPRKGCQHPTREGCSQARSPVDLRREAGLTEQPCADQDKPPGFQQC